MSPLFGKKHKPSTIAVLDIESGSVGSALVHLVPGKKPRLMAQSRSPLVVRSSRSAGALLTEIEREVEQSLIRLSGVASRVRNYTSTPETIDRVAVFLHAPWVSVSLDTKSAKAEAHDATLDLLKKSVRITGVPATFHAFSTTATPIIHGVFNHPTESLVVSIGSEIAELSLMNDNLVVGHATVPGGLEMLLRTIQTHAGVSKGEALSILTLSKHTREHVWAEAVSAGVAQLTRELRTTAEDILPDYKSARHVFILAPHESGDFLARTLTEDSSVHSLFAPGSTVRAVSSTHVSPHLVGHPDRPDIPLMLESLFVDTRFGI